MTGLGDLVPDSSSMGDASSRGSLAALLRLCLRFFKARPSLDLRSLCFLFFLCPSSPPFTACRLLLLVPSSDAALESSVDSPLRFLVSEGESANLIMTVIDMETNKRCLRGSIGPKSYPGWKFCHGRNFNFAAVPCMAWRRTLADHRGRVTSLTRFSLLSLVMCTLKLQSFSSRTSSGVIF